jgi:uncharacterized protein YqeY
MSLLETIREHTLSARKNKAPEAGGLVTLLGEIDTKAKTLKPARDLKDDEVVAIVRKFLKGINEMMELSEAAPDDKLKAEKAALERYLPKQMSEDEIRDFCKARIAEGLNMGQIMGALKASHPGQYDGKLASGIAKSLLAG